MTDDSTWETVERLKQWLDDNDGLALEMAPVMRLLKLQEEIGEAAQATMGALGANPRKGKSHTWEDAEAEVCDVILSGMVLLATLTPHAAKRFEERLGIIAERSLVANP
ncbi:MazG-like family protein [Actinacidiphila rubida]|uniref:NTP pyrophosphohydrolase MazG putative catalytic core domain-containing protein n=1 Tax=Actinacidiphila rubida TaxID=310780 RepID=A0A1H8QMF2_9ACTN|nr:MazG-like family protein [Actinacidiphila rubida]SEO55425.1 hypothetical protein SAMN05216267_103079 [Actinacidiphila rubida]